MTSVISRKDSLNNMLKTALALLFLVKLLLKTNFYAPINNEHVLSKPLLVVSWKPEYDNTIFLALMRAVFYHTNSFAYDINTSCIQLVTAKLIITILKALINFQKILLLQCN